MRRVGTFLGGALLFGILVGTPARYMWGEPALVFFVVALLLCLVPTTLTLVWAEWALTGSPEQQLTMVLGGTGVRMFAVLTGGAVLYWFVPYFQNQQSFWIWVLICYFFTLALEMGLVLSKRPKVHEQVRPNQQ
jgi:hypothetical protein